MDKQLKDFDKTTLPSCRKYKCNIDNSIYTVLNTALEYETDELYVIYQSTVTNTIYTISLEKFNEIIGERKKVNTDSGEMIQIPRFSVWL